MEDDSIVCRLCRASLGSHTLGKSIRTKVNASGGAKERTRRESLDVNYTGQKAHWRNKFTKGRKWRDTEREGGVVDVAKLLEKIIAQNDLIIRQNEKLLTLIAARTNKKDADLLAELKKINVTEEKKRSRRQN